ncbi:MAG: class I SAM-dependent methyltransferase [Solirubrobacterales bacterium]
MSEPRNCPGETPAGESSPRIETQNVPCALCGSTDADVLFDAVDRLHDVPGSFRYVRCRKCGLVYMNPQVVPRCIGSLYPREYAPHADKAKSQRKGLRSIRERLTATPIVGRIFRAVTDPRALGPLLRELDAGKRLLDVGCGNGAFLDAMRRLTGCEVFGVDFSPMAVEQAKRLYDLDVFQGTVDEAPYPEKSFDVVTAWWYLEHVPDPRTCIAKMARLLKEGGLCAVGVPNYDSCWARAFRDKWYHLDCPRHLGIWTPTAIRRLFVDCGLSVTGIAYDRTPWGLLGSLQYRLYGDNRNPAHKNRIRQSALLWLLCLPLTLLVSVLHKSDIITVFARRGNAS